MNKLIVNKINNGSRFKRIRYFVRKEKFLARNYISLNIELIVNEINNG